MQPASRNVHHQYHKSAHVTVNYDIYWEFSGSSLCAAQLLMNVHTFSLQRMASSVTWIIWTALISLHSVGILKPSVFILILSPAEPWCSSHQRVLHAGHRLLAPRGAWQWATSPSDAVRSEPMKRFGHLQRKAFYSGGRFPFFSLTRFPFRLMNRNASKATKLGILATVADWFKTHPLQHSVFCDSFSFISKFLAFSPPCRLEWGVAWYAGAEMSDVGLKQNMPKRWCQVLKAVF